MKIFKVAFPLMTAILLVTGCGNKQTAFSTDGLEAIYIPEYAEGFSLYAYGDGVILEINKPWQGADSSSGIMYFLSNGDEPAPEGFNGETIKLPLKKVVSMSSSYSAFLEALSVGDLIKGVSGTGFISSPKLQELIQAGDIRDVGYDNAINFEVLLDISPDVIFTYGVNGENTSLSTKAKELGMKTVYIGEYLESSPLGKAEWIMVFGEMTGRRELAGEIFSTIAEEYNEAKRTVENLEHKPSVILNSSWRDTWFVPGDRNYMVQLINDAGGDYICKGEDTQDSRPISTENAYLYALKADFWLNPGSADSVGELISDNPNFSEIPAVKEGKVYNNNARKTPAGGSDFWESGAVYPHIILKDLIKILHPDSLSNHELYFYKQL